MKIFNDIAHNLSWVEFKFLTFNLNTLDSNSLLQAWGYGWGLDSTDIVGKP
jgi:hypothetical protein